jgi:hypothetical protein
MRMKETFHAAFAAIAIGGVLGLCIWEVFRDKKMILAKFNAPGVGEMAVIGTSPNRFEGWSVALVWQKARGAWASYYLAHEAPRWKGVQLVQETNNVLVKLEDRIVGTLNVNDGKFFNALQNHLHERPTRLVLSEDPFNETERIYPESPGWDAVWPSVTTGQNSTGVPH